MEPSWSLFTVCEDGTLLHWQDELAGLTGQRPGDVVGLPCHRCLEFWDAATGERVCAASCPLLGSSRRGEPAFMDRLVRLRTGVPARLVAMTVPAPRGGAGVVAHLLRPLPGLDRLTPTELRVLALVRHGCPTEAVAERLGVRVSTVRTHIRRILDKLGARSRVEAVASIAGPTDRWPTSPSPDREGRPAP